MLSNMCLSFVALFGQDEKTKLSTDPPWYNMFHDQAILQIVRGGSFNVFVLLLPWGNHPNWLIFDWGVQAPASGVQLKPLNIFPVDVCRNSSPLLLTHFDSGLKPPTTWRIIPVSK